MHDRNRSIPEALERAIRYAPAEAQALLEGADGATAEELLASALRAARG